MSLAHRYATLIRSLKSSEVEQVISYMKHRGHLSLLPQVVRIAEREEQPQETVTVSRQEDVAAAKAKYPQAKVKIDTDLVGGMIHRSGTTITDTSIRSQLVSLYQKAVGIV